MKYLPAILKQIGDTSSHIKKVKIIKKHGDVLALPFYYALSPYLRYHIRQIPSSVKGRGRDLIGPDTWAILNRLVKRELTGLEAKYALFNHMELLAPEQCEVLKRIVRKRLDIGVSIKLVNKAYGRTIIEEHKVMLAHRYSSDRVQWPVLVSPKIDGVRATFKNGAFHSRNGHRLVGLDHLAGFLLFRRSDWNLDGELWIPNMDFNEMSGVIRNLNSSKPTVKYAVFDTRGTALPQRQRLDWLAKHLPLLGSGFAVEQIPYVVAYNSWELGALYRSCRTAGYEGIMIKNPQALYQEKRSWDWMKWKPLESKEFPIQTVVGGEGKYSHMLGNIIVKLPNGKTTDVGSGFTDEERKKYWEHPGLIIGKMATVEYMELLPTGKLRHPIFKGIRWDI